MKDYRLRIPIDEAYLYALGLATICFARLEWNAVWCCEKIGPGYIQRVAAKTAGQSANDLVHLAAKHSDPTIVGGLGTGAAEFKRLVSRRNDLVHANPGPAKTGEQRLFRHGTEWTIQMVDQLSDEFASAGRQLNHHYQNLL